MMTQASQAVIRKWKACPCGPMLLNPHKPGSLGAMIPDISVTVALCH